MSIRPNVPFQIFRDLALRFLGKRNPEPKRARAEDHLVYVFAGQFGTGKAARAYCLEPSAPHPPDAPTQLTVDLPEAYVDPAGMYIAHGPQALDQLLSVLPMAEAEKLFEREGTDTWIVLTAKAFGGFPFRLHDTPRLTYLGPYPAKD